MKISVIEMANEVIVPVGDLFNELENLTYMDLFVNDLVTTARQEFYVDTPKLYDVINTLNDIIKLTNGEFEGYYYKVRNRYKRINEIAREISRRASVRYSKYMDKLIKESQRDYVIQRISKRA